MSWKRGSEETPEKSRTLDLIEQMKVVLDRSVTPQGRPAEQASGAGGVNIQINFVKPDDGEGARVIKWNRNN